MRIWYLALSSNVGSGKPALVQTNLSLHSSHMQSMQVGDGSDQNLDL